MNDQIRRRRHTRTHDQGSEVRVHRVRSLMGGSREGGGGVRRKQFSFPVQFCALDSAFGALRAAAYTGEVQQGPGGLLQLLVQLGLRLAPRPLAGGPLDGRRASRSLVDAPLVPEVGVLVAVEALTAGAVGLPALAASFVQGGEGRGGGAGGAALHGDAAVVVVLLGIAAHQDRVGSGEVQRAVGIAWGKSSMRRAASARWNLKAGV